MLHVTAAGRLPASQSEYLAISGILVLIIIASFQLFGPPTQLSVQRFGTCLVRAVQGDLSACGSGGAGGAPPGSGGGQTWGQWAWNGTRWVMVGTWNTTKDVIVNGPSTQSASGAWNFVKGAWVWATGIPGGRGQSQGQPAGGRT